VQEVDNLTNGISYPARSSGEAAQFYVLKLKDELAHRCDKNHQYSLRAFAKSLEIDVGLLSKILSGKRKLSPKTSKKILKHLTLSPEEKDLFLKSIVDEQHREQLKSVGMDRLSVAKQTKELDREQFRVIASLYHYAILELTMVEGFQPNPIWIAKTLEISVIEASLAIDRLKRLGLLEERDGRLVKVDGHITTANKQITTPALLMHQRQTLERAINSLDNDPIHTRSMTSMTMAIDPDKLELAKKLIQEFMEFLCCVLESGKRLAVYQLGISLFPISRRKE